MFPLLMKASLGPKRSCDGCVCADLRSAFFRACRRAGEYRTEQLQAQA